MMAANVRPARPPSPGRASPAPPQPVSATTAPPDARSPGPLLDEETIREATRGMTADEALQFRAKMSALSRVLQDEVKELEAQHTKLMTITEKGETGQTLSKSNVRNLKKKTSSQRPSVTDVDTVVVLKGDDAENMMKRLLEKIEGYENEIRILKHERESNNYIKDQNKARIQMYEESIASTENMLMEAYQRLHVSANELSLKNRKIIELETKLGLKQTGKKTIDELRLKEDLHDKEVIQMKTRLGMLEKENVEQRLKIEQLQAELKRIKDEANAEGLERRTRLERRRRERGHPSEEDDDKSKHLDSVSSASSDSLGAAGRSAASAAAAPAPAATALPLPAPVAKAPDVKALPPSPAALAAAKSTPPPASEASAGSAGSAVSPRTAKATMTAAAAAPAPRVVKPVLYKAGAPRRLVKSEQVFVSFSMNVLLLDASLDGDLDLVKLCIKNGGDVNQPNEEGLTPLHSAACNGHAKIVNYLLENGAHVNVVDDDLWTPLHGAACFGEVAVVRDLVQHGANVVALNTEGDMPIDIAVEEKTKKYLQEVMENRTKATQLYALYEFEAEEDDELSFGVGALLTILTPEAERDQQWWMAQSLNKKKGFIPANYVGLYAPTTKL